MRFNIKDVDEYFVKKAIRDIEKDYKSLIESLKIFDRNLQANFTPMTEFDPVAEKEVDHKFPLAYHIKILYGYVLGEIDVKDYNNEINESLNIINELFFHNPLFRSVKYNIRKDSFYYNSRLGFIYYLANLKQRMLNGDTFSAREAALMSGYTNQGFISKLKSMPNLDLQKANGQYILANDTVKKLVKTSDSPLWK